MALAREGSPSSEVNDYSSKHSNVARLTVVSYLSSVVCRLSSVVRRSIFEVRGLRREIQGPRPQVWGLGLDD